MNKIILALTFIVFLFGCSKEEPKNASQPAKGGGAVTLWTEKTELFMEYPALIVGKEARFAVHLTRLSDFSAITDGRIQLTFQSSAGTTLNAEVEKPTSPGIYRPRMKFEKSGTYKLSMTVAATNDVLNVEDIRVYDSPEQIPEETAEQGAEPLISYLKEQQWKTTFRTEPVAKRMFSSSVRASGIILSKKNLDVVVSAPFAGVLQPEHNGRVPTVGSVVRNGQVIATLTPAAQTADGSDNFAKQYVEAKSKKSLAESEFERAKQLYATGGISSKEYQEAEAEFKEAEANFAAIAKYVQPDDEKPQRPNEFNFLLKAPISGTVTEAQFVLGKQFNAGEPLFRIVNSSTVWLQAFVPVAEAGKLRSPRRAEFHIAGFDETFEVNETNGRLVSFSSVVDEKSRTVPVIFEIANPQQRLRIGMFADALIKTGKEENLLVVPESALIEEEGRYSVYVHVEGEAFAKRDVELDGKDRGYVAVVRGVREGERVVSTGAYQVRLASLSTQLPAHGHEH